MSPLVRFDRKTLAVLGFLLTFLILGTVFRLHGSSIGIWYQRLNRGTPAERRPDPSLLLGTPRWDRIDEWNIFTPAIVSQATVQPSFPIVNRRWGAAEVPLVFKLPTRHWSMLVRPQLWAFFVLDLERAYAFYWDMRAVFLVGGVFLLLMLLTSNDFWVSLFGAAWVFFSGLIQWWYSNQLLPESIGCIALVIVASHHLVLSRRRWVRAVSAAVVFVCAANFALALYPPYQVPLLYLGAVVGGASLGRGLRTLHRDGALASRLLPVGLVLCAVAGVLVLFHRDAREGIALMRATIYPGSRLVSGGDLGVARVFGGFFGFFMTPDRFPETWGNICEASNFVLLFPIPAAVLVARWWRGRSTSALEWGLLGYILVLLGWTVVGWPRWLAAVSGFGLSPPVRSLSGLGVASILFCCVFLARSRVEIPGGLGGRVLVVGCLAAAVVLYVLDFDRGTSGFATPAESALVVVAVVAAGYFLLTGSRLACALTVLLPQVWSYGLVNPIAMGLGPVLDSQAFQRLSALVARDPDARWIVYGDITASTFLKMAGARVFNGMNIIPPIDDFRAIDPEGTGMSVYNRYGYMVLVPERGSTVTLTNVRDDLYEMHADATSEVWRRLGIRYVVLPAPSTDPEFLGQTTLVAPGLWIYRYRESGGAAGRP